MTFEKMSEYLNEQAAQIVGASIDITMGALKTIPIFVPGSELLPETYFEYALIKRLHPPGLETSLVPINLAGVRIYWTREIRDWTQILFQIAVAAGVLAALY